MGCARHKFAKAAVDHILLSPTIFFLLFWLDLANLKFLCFFANKWNEAKIEIFQFIW